MEENGLDPFSKRKLGPPIQEVPKKFEIFPASSFKAQKKLAPHKKIFVVRGGVYTIENKDTDRDYQKFVRVGDQK